MDWQRIVGCTGEHDAHRLHDDQSTKTSTSNSSVHQAAHTNPANRLYSRVGRFQQDENKKSDDLQLRPIYEKHGNKDKPKASAEQPHLPVIPKYMHNYPLVSFSQFKILGSSGAFSMSQESSSLKRCRFAVFWSNSASSALRLVPSCCCCCHRRRRRCICRICICICICCICCCPYPLVPP